MKIQCLRIVNIHIELSNEKKVTDTSSEKANDFGNSSKLFHDLFPFLQNSSDKTTYFTNSLRLNKLICIK